MIWDEWYEEEAQSFEESSFNFDFSSLLSKPKDYYKILEVDYHANDDSIRSNYIRLALKWHPDKKKDEDTATLRFQDINEAYTVLSDPVKRREYDKHGMLYVYDHNIIEYLNRYKGLILTCNGLGVKQSIVLQAPRPRFYKTFNRPFNINIFPTSSKKAILSTNIGSCREYYKILEVDYHANDDSIRSNYIRLALKWHPDKKKDEDTATLRFQDINEAYTVLSDPVKRREYDKHGMLYVYDHNIIEYLNRYKGLILTCNGLGVKQSIVEYYKILEVDYHANDDSIRSNYIRLALKWHPDKKKDEDTATLRFQDINEAYTVLSDPVKRREYDKHGMLYVYDHNIIEYLNRYKGLILTCNGLGVKQSIV